MPQLPHHHFAIFFPVGPPEEKVRESLKISAIWPLSKPASNNSRSAEVSRWVPGRCPTRKQSGEGRSSPHACVSAGLPACTLHDARLPVPTCLCLGRPEKSGDERSLQGLPVVTPISLLDIIRVDYDCPRADALCVCYNTG